MRWSDDPSKGWIGVDLDRTLAYRDSDGGAQAIGEPVPAMVARVQQWLKEGRLVKIFTARVSKSNVFDDQAEQRQLVEDWCDEYIGCVLPVTCEKDYYCVAIWDDLAVAVEENTGRPLSPVRPFIGPPLPL